MGEPNATRHSAPFASVIKEYRPDLKPYEELYKHCHANGELSTQEKETAALITDRLKKLSSDLDIRTGIGGHGQVAILKNGSGPTILLRADIDALPVQEKTGLDYASTKTMRDTDGLVKPVMHACGHDFHITSLLAAAETLIAARSKWSGTIVFLFQPAEERGSGARAMIDDGLYAAEKHACPIPDIVLGQHVFPLQAGKTATRAGPVMSAADSFKVTIYGSGGHGSMPHRTIDPVVIASHVVVRLQSIVSREVPPDETAVVTVGALQAGSTENVISDEAVLKINIRSVSSAWRERLLASVKRIIQAECLAGNCPKEPLIEETSSFPLTVNDDAVAGEINKSFTAYFGPEAHDPSVKNVLGSEDFGMLGSAINRPYCFWFFGGHDAAMYEEMKAKGEEHKIPVNHSPFFAPVVQPTLTVGVDALVVAALTYVGKSE
ncbi:hippurate hydrolase [Cladophialophora yegresii CBS 114405]|uniref:Hippurate hydrolase n=1 Tax=Cladophialophora yegresii CBS 114405 TaxID=1182544 RepID=W9W2J8_9EURO|nr:hippurate hydrolase [Cladophialophora yegresii CBS 114405]EXJ62183.1 hippurate hydrolase [Cladophialophora yegresii CBS 114405]